MPFDGSSGETAPPLPFRRSRCGYSERASRECASTRRSSGLGLNSSSRQVPRHSNTLRYSTTSTPGRRSRGCRDSAQPRWSRGPAAAISRNGELDPRYKKILDQLNKQQQQRARGWPFGSAASACVTTRGTRSRRSWWCRRPRPHVAWGVVKDGTNHRCPGPHQVRARWTGDVCRERKPAIYI